MVDRRNILAFLIAAIVPVASSAEEPNQKALAKLNGVWDAEKILSSGRQVPNERFPFELHFKDDKLRFKRIVSSKRKDRVHELKLDTSNEPFLMDIVRVVGDKRMTVYAIYKFEGEELLICSLRGPDGQPSKERPTSFESSPAINSELLILKRKQRSTE